LLKHLINNKILVVMNQLVLKGLNNYQKC
jgi:hypothetical protein